MMSDLYPYKILVVEDEEAIRKNYIIFLKMFFKEVYEADDGEIAYNLYKSEKPDIMIVDINIPKLNGLELIKKIREKDFTTKIIILTAHSDKYFLFEAIELKLTKYLVKPVSRKDLNEALDLAINEISQYTILNIKNIQLTDEYSWNCELKQLKFHNEIIDLTNKEKNFLSLLLSHKNKAFNYDEIFEYVWTDEELISLNSLKNLVKRLRKKLPKNMISNVFNEGYKINF